MLLIDVEKNQNWKLLLDLLEEEFSSTAKKSIVSVDEEGAKIKLYQERRRLIEYIMKNKEFPHRLCYHGQGAVVWKAISKNSDYTLGRRERDALERFMEEMEQNIKAMGNLNILHIGPGTGDEGRPIIKTIGTSIKSYTLIDTSPELLLESAQVIKRIIHEIEEDPRRITVYTRAVDVSSGQDRLGEIAENMRQKNAPQNLFFLVGNGSILSNPDVLKNIRNAMTSDDKLILTVEAYSKEREKEILDQYKMPLILQLFASGLSILGINVKEGHESKYFEDFRYNEEDSVIEIFFNLQKWYQENPTATGVFEKLLHNKINQIKVFTSYKPPSEGALMEYLRRNGFEVDKDQVHYFPEYQCFGCICSPK